MHARRLAGFQADTCNPGEMLEAAFQVAKKDPALAEIVRRRWRNNEWLCKKNPSRELLFKDAENIVSFLKTKNYAQTMLFAESIGSGVASYHATLTPVDRMLFIAPFDSLVNLAQTKLPVYPMSLLEKVSNENYDNLELLREYTGELRIIHGAKDNVIPLSRGKALFENVNIPEKDFIIIDGAGHNDIYNFENTWKSIADFL